jgi:quinol-cytochrome oxidoreductase complex cytochrome b subunit
MKFSSLKQDKGVAGLSILLSLITMLFVIGLLVMIFALMGGELMDSTTDATADQVINDTTTSISSVTDWYPIFIVIGAMVVLILLTVIIITAIRGSGMMGGEGSA